MLTSTSSAVSTSVKGLTYQELDILHCLRGFCAFYVVIYHAKYLLWSGGRQFLTAYPRETWSVLDYAYFGIDMLSSAGFEMVVFFFVLSGFFIRYAQRKRHRPAVAFYINRVVRIYPPYLFSVLISIYALACIVNYVPLVLNVSDNRELNQEIAKAWQELQDFRFHNIANVLGFSRLDHTYVGSNGVYWSLLPEALFYLSIPLAFRYIKAYYILSTLAFATGAVLNVLHVEMTPFSNFLVTHNFYFAVGVGLYDAVVDTKWVAIFQRANGWLLSVAVIVLFTIILFLAILKLKLLSGIIAVILAIVAISSLLAGRVKRENPLVRLMHSIGIFSFSLYLFHYPLLLLCYGLLVYITGQQFSYLRYYWLAVPVVTVGSYLLYWVTERVSVNYFRKV
ncbi:acyltransferase family protein [Hymenobacter puniceus]|uniref:acyltransferase family protein n=1 Tax=Hymenobacter sp. BT190 TaxID=2763505 RepID=UPI001650ED6E|nr:acyltransferase [Hymenobacter sp. BT190]MBC6697809.1 acyltransferase [Hymenobacter sp. BT190]